MTSKNVLTAGRYRLISPYVSDASTPKKQLDPVLTEQDAEQQSNGHPSTSRAKQGTDNIPIKQNTKKVELSALQSEEAANVIKVIENYLQECGVIASMEKFTGRLLQNDIYPYNPYPGFIRLLGKKSEMFFMDKDSLTSLKSKYNFTVTSVSNSVLSNSKEPKSNLWGLSHILSHVNPVKIEKYRKIFNQSSISSQQASEICGKEINVLLSVKGPCMFSGSLYRDWQSLDLHVTIAFTSENVNYAVSDFTNVILNDLKYTHTHDNFVLLQLKVSTGNINKSTAEFRVWEMSRLLPLLNDSANNRQDTDLHQFISNAMTSPNATIVVDTLYCCETDLNYPCITVSKSYNLLLILGNGKDTIKRVKTSKGTIFYPFPYQALHEGIFLEQDHAQLYLTFFQKHLNQIRSVRSKADILGTTIVQSVVSAWKHRISLHKLHSDPWDTIHLMVLIKLLETRSKALSNLTEEDLIIQASRFFSSFATQLKLSTVLSKPACILSSHEKNPVIDFLARQYKTALLGVIDPNLSSRSSDVKALRRVVHLSLNKECAKEIASTAFDTENIKLLHSMTYIMLLGLIENALELCATVKTFMHEIEVSFSKDDSAVVYDQAPVVEHGLKAELWPKTSKLVIDKQQCIANSLAPRHMAGYFTGLQYMADTQLDQVLKTFIELLLLERNHLPPNPFPILISVLRQANTRMQTSFDTDLNLTRKVQMKKFNAVENTHDIFSIKGTQAYGKKDSLTYIQPKSYRIIAALAQTISLSSYTASTSEYSNSEQVLSFTGIPPRHATFGALTPYIPAFSVGEFCFIRHNEGLTSLAKCLLQNLESLESNESIIMHEARFGDSALSMYDIKEVSTSFESALIASVSQRDRIVISFFYPYQWRYLLIEKHIFVFETNSFSREIAKPQSLFHISESDLFPYWVFASAEGASYCSFFDKYRLTDILPLQISWKSKDWRNFVSILACGKMLTKYVENAHLPVSFAMKFCNTIPGDLEYLINLNITIQKLASTVWSIIDGHGRPQSSFNAGLLESMLLQYYLKIKEILKQNCCLCPSFLVEHTCRIIQRFSSLIDTKLNSLNFDESVFQEFAEINGYLIALQNPSAEDLVSITPWLNTLLEF